MDCSNCGAPLPAKSNVCKYCDTLNETDLRALRRPARGSGESARACPRCTSKMKIVQLEVGDGLEIDRCEDCKGIFFDPDELESLLDAAVSRVYEADIERLGRIIEEELRSPERKVSYVPCPDCQQLMNRKVFGARSGVIVDRCKGHGVWLDGGELEQLLKWTKAGGQIHDRNERERQTAERKARASMPSMSGAFAGGTVATKDVEDDGLLGILSYVVRNWL